MKNVLLGTSALVASFAFANTAAAAGMDVTISGYMLAEFGIMDSDSADQESGEMRLEHEIHFDGKAVSENGLEYGFHTELTNDSNTTADDITADEASLYVSGSFGKIELGDNDGAADSLRLYAPTIGMEGVDGDYVNFVDNYAQPVGFYEGLDSGDSTKITYMTPVFNGFQAGVSYAPKNDAGANVVTDETTGDYEDIIEAAVAYTGTVDQFNYGVSVAIVDGSAVNSATLEDFTAWSLGTQVGFGGWTVGAAYNDNDDAGNAPGSNDDNYDWNLGVAYENGPWAVSAQYADGEGNTDIDGTGVHMDDFTTYGVSAVYEVAPGLTVEGDLVMFDTETGATDNDGYVAILATRVAF